MTSRPLDDDELRTLDAYWRAANYCSVGQIYLMDNPLLAEPLRPEHIKPRLLGHFGTTPGLNLIYAHLNRVIKARDLNLMYVIGPGHGGPGIVANAYLEGTYSEVYPHVSEDLKGLKRLFRQFSFPGGIPSHVAPQTPGSIHEGGELGYSLVHAYGAALDNPDLIVACVIGDGEAETGPLAASWHSNKFLDPVGDGAVLPILHLNGYKIANPTILARIGDDELSSLLTGYGHRPLFVEGDDPAEVHQQLAAALDDALDDIAGIQAAARNEGTSSRPAWPMIVLRTPKGWTCPKEVDGVPIEGTFRAHQVPVSDVRTNPEHLEILEEWLQSYRPQELFDESGRLRGELRAAAPSGDAAYERQSACQRGPAVEGAGSARLQAIRRRGRASGSGICRANPGARNFPPGRHQGESHARFGSSVLTRRSPTGSPQCSNRQIGSGRPRRCRGTSSWPPRVG